MEEGPAAATQFPGKGELAESQRAAIPPHRYEIDWASSGAKARYLEEVHLLLPSAFEALSLLGCPGKGCSAELILYTERDYRVTPQLSTKMSGMLERWRRYRVRSTELARISFVWLAHSVHSSESADLASLPVSHRLYFPLYKVAEPHGLRGSIDRLRQMIEWPRSSRREEFSLSLIQKLDPKIQRSPVPSSWRADHGEPDRARVLIGAHWLDVGGAENLVVQNVLFCKRLGLEVHVITERAGPNRLLSQIAEHADRVFTLPNMVPKELRRELLERLCSRYRYTYIHIHHCRLLYEAIPGIKRAHPNTRVFDSNHIVEFNNGGFPALSVRYSEFIDRHHVISKDLVRRFTEQAQIPRERICLGYMAEAEKGQSPPEVSGGKGKNGSLFSGAIGNREVSVLFVGRMVPQKAPEIFVDFARELVERQPDRRFAFTLVGEGPELEACVRRAAGIGSAADIRFLAHDVDIQREMAKASFLVSTSINEGLPLVFFEATRSNTLCLATDVGGNSEIIGRSQLFAPVRSRVPGAMAQRVIELLEGEGKYRQELSGQQKLYQSILRQPGIGEAFSRLYGG